MTLESQKMLTEIISWVAIVACLQRADVRKFFATLLSSHSEKVDILHATLCSGSIQDVLQDGAAKLIAGRATERKYMKYAGLMDSHLAGGAVELYTAA